MAGYSDSEIEGAVSSFVRSDIKVQRDALGPVDVGAKFSETVELISSTLLFDPNAIFYLIFLATNKLNMLVETAIGYVEDVIQAIADMDRRTKDVTQTSLLADAATALLTVDQILTSNDVVSRSALTRYVTAVDRFAAVSLTPNIKKAGAIVRSPQLARKDMRVTLPALSSAWTQILSTLGQIEDELEEFNGLNLPVLAAQSSVRQVRRDLQSLRGTFEDSSTTRDDKISSCRDAYLRLTAGKAVLNNYTTMTDPADPRMASSSVIVGRAAVPVGDEGEFTAPSVTCAKSAPWSITTGINDELKLAEDGNPETTYTIVPPTQPSVRGYISDLDAVGFFTIVAGVNDQLEIDGLAPPIPLTAGVARTAAQIVSDIDAWITANYLGVYSVEVLTEGTKTYVKITKTQEGIQRIRVTANDPAYTELIRNSWATLGMYVGQEDTNNGVTAGELAEQLNVAGKVSAEVVRTYFEEGSNGSVVDTTQFEVPLNTTASLLHENDILVINSPENVGSHQIASVVRDTLVDRVTVSSSTPFDLAATNQDWRIVREVVKITSVAGGLTAELEIGDGNANDTLGLTACTVKGTTTGFRAAVSGVDEDFTRRDVRERDIVRISTAPGDTDDYTVLELADSNRQLELDPPLDVDLNVTTYPALQFHIFSAAAIAYAEFQSALTEWRDILDASDFKTDILELERVMNPLLTNKQPSEAQTTDARIAAGADPDVDGLLQLLTNADPLKLGLTEVLVAYQVSAVPRMDAALKMLRERGLDRAYDLLMDGEIANFFGMDKDDASSSAYMLKSMRSIVQSDLRVSKLEEDADELVHGASVSTTDADLDYSDMDGDENIQILGEVPDGVSTPTLRTRY